MKTKKTFFTVIGVFVLLFLSGNKPDYNNNPERSNSGQTTTKSPQTVSKSAQTATKSTKTNSKSTQTVTKSTQSTSKTKQTGSKSKQTSSKPAPTTSKADQNKKVKDPGAIIIGTQTWAVANLNVSTFRNGDTIPETKTNEEWKNAGDAKKPAWCYYNNDPVTGKKYGKLYNWYAVNDPRGLAPTGWTLPDDADWIKLTNFLGGQGVAGTKLKTASGWKEDNNGSNESGFTGLPGGYRVENGIFLNLGSIGSWWTSTENNSQSAFDRYLVLNGSLGRSNSPKQRGSSVRCIKE